ncbi:MAG: PDZ domain-containing protein, partial [Rhodospirillales bacterium]
VNDPQALDYRIATLVLGKKAEVTILRKGREMTLSFIAQQPPEDPPRNVTELKGVHPLSGSVVANMSPALADELGLAGFRPGVVIMKIRRGSAASRFFQPGDMIEEINGTKTRTVAVLSRVMAARVNEWRIRLVRGNEPMNVVIGR